ncbi:MAG TPA: hypothetical protein VHM30_09845 [Gemmatimonadaceae bacterium]|nr:hypothetical protein [Gemmatimonadaceae bacterium]
MTRHARWCLALAIALLPARAALAQSIWTPLDHRITARGEWWHAHFKSDVGAPSTGSAAMFFSVGFPVNEKVALTFELPYARVSAQDPFFGKIDDNTVGNPYVGVQLGALNKPVSYVGELGARVSSVSEGSFFAAIMGAFSEMDRAEAFAPKTATLAAAGNIVIRRTGSSSRLRLGVSEMLASGSGSENTTLLDYGAQTAVDLQQVRFGGALTGRYQVNGSGSFGDKSTHAVTGMTSIALGDFRPSLAIRVPFDKDVRDVAPWTVALGVEWEIH